MNDCAICLSDEMTFPVRPFDCSHKFDFTCIDPWIKKYLNTTACPNCRQPLKIALKKKIVFIIKKREQDCNISVSYISNISVSFFKIMLLSFSISFLTIFYCVFFIKERKSLISNLFFFFSLLFFLDFILLKSII